MKLLLVLSIVMTFCHFVLNTTPKLPKPEKKSESDEWQAYMTGAIEGRLFRRTRELISLSEQNLVDCSSHNMNCVRGWPTLAYYDIRYTIGGLVPSEVYTYEGQNGSCRYNANQSVVKVLNYVSITAGDEAELTDAVANIGPIAIAIHACNRNENYKYYSEGIYDFPNQNCCSDTGVNHDMLVVGYGVENEIDYWIVKNSWGTDWGENGYIRIKRGDNMCGIANYATYPNIEPIPTDRLTASGTKNLLGGTNSRNAISAAAEARLRRNMEFILVLPIVTLFNFLLQ